MTSNRQSFNLVPTATFTEKISLSITVGQSSIDNKISVAVTFSNLQRLKEGGGITLGLTNLLPIFEIFSSLIIISSKLLF